MKINGSTDSIRIDGGTGPAAGGRAAAAVRVAGEAGARVELSELAGQLGRLATDLAAEPPFDAERVEAIKAAIRNGELRVNPDAIADALIRSVRELLAGKA